MGIRHAPHAKCVTNPQHSLHLSFIDAPEICESLPQTNGMRQLWYMQQMQTRKKQACKKLQKNSRCLRLQGQPSPWKELSIFTKWFQHFLSHTKPLTDDLALVIMNEHMTQTQNLDGINLARDYYVTMQPLDVSFLKPLLKHSSDTILTSKCIV